MQDHVPGAPDGLKGPLDQMGPGLDQHLDGHVIGDVAALDELPADLKLGLRGGGEADLDLLDADVQQGVEILQLFLEIHGVHQGLIAVPQVHRAPDGGLGDLLVGPGAVLHLEGDKGNILLKRLAHDAYLRT